MRNHVGTASIIKNTNKLISSSDWRGGRVGSFFKFTQDSNHYVIAKIEPLFYLIEFEKVSDRKIKVKANTGINLNIYDTVKVSYKQWEVYTVTKIHNNGKGYKIGDILSLQGGKPCSNSQDNIKEVAKISVDNTDESGAILKISLSDKGKYYETPTGNISVTGSKGIGAEFEVQFKLCEKRTLLERDIENVEFDGTETFITLNYNIPTEVKSGKIGADKWEIFLSTNYIEGSRINEEYETTRDFSPRLGIPLLVKGSMSVDCVFNSAVVIMEKKILELEERIKKLEFNGS